MLSMTGSENEHNRLTPSFKVLCGLHPGPRPIHVGIPRMLVCKEVRESLEHVSE